MEANLSSLTLCTGSKREKNVDLETRSLSGTHAFRDSAGDYTCRASNVHGTVETTMTFSVVYSPSCTVTHSVEGADLLLKCSADANPEVVSSFGKLAL